MWIIQIERGRDAGGKRNRLTRQIKGSKKEAEAEEARLQRELSMGVFVDPSKETLAQYLQSWLGRVQGQLAPSAYLSYRRIVDLRWAPALGSLRVQQVRAPHISKVEATWLRGGRLGPGKGKGLSAKTVLNFHRVLHEALEAAVREGLLVVNPCDGVSLPRRERREMASLGAEEVARLLEAIMADERGVALHTLLATGLRAGEVLGLRWRDVDLGGQGGVVRVQQQWDRVAKRYREVKTHRSRRPVPIDAVLVSDLRRQRVQQAEWRLGAGEMWTDSGLVFTDRLGRGLHHDQLSYALERCLKRAGLGHLGPHGLRHTHASLLIAAGTHMKVVQERLGHASFGITADTYSHVAPGLGTAAAEDFRRVLRKESG